ncbi:MAG: VWA-like domain-containing protein [Sulfurimonas sp.]
MDPRKKITATQIKLLRSNLGFFGTLLLHPVYEESQEVPLAAISSDMQHLLYNPQAVEKINIEELKTILTHEVLHLAFQHPARRENREMQKWNIATDIEINTVLYKHGFKQPRAFGDLFPENSYKLTIPASIFGKEITIKQIKLKIAEKIYTELPDLPTDYEEPQNRSHNWHEKQKKFEKRQWRNALQDATMAQPGIGQEDGVLRRIMQNIFNPKLHWRHLLTREIKSSISHLQTWKRPHRRSHSLGFYIPAYKRDAIDVDIFVDTSGSISDREYNEFVAEIKGIMNSYPRVEGKVHYWNMQVYKSFDIDKEFSQIKNFYHKVQSGGTRLSSVNEYLQEQNRVPNTTVVFTDGRVEKVNNLIGKHVILVVNKKGKPERVKHLGCLIELD